MVQTEKPAAAAVEPPSTLRPGGLDFEAFYQAEFRGVLALLLAMMPSRAQAEDLTQESFIAAHKAWATVESHPNPEAWIRRVALNRGYSALRRAKSEAKAVARIHEPDAYEPDFDDYSDVWDAVRALPKRQQQVVLLRYVDELSIQEISDSLQISPGSVKSTLFKARGNLRNVADE